MLSSSIYNYCILNITFLWWFFRGCSPLPLPNRVVKPLMADGTAPKCGRVGSCHIYLPGLSVFAERLFYFSDLPFFDISRISGVDACALSHFHQEEGKIWGRFAHPEGVMPEQKYGNTKARENERPGRSLLGG